MAKEALHKPTDAAADPTTSKGSDEWSCSHLWVVIITLCITLAMVSTIALWNCGICQAKCEKINVTLLRLHANNFDLVHFDLVHYVMLILQKIMKSIILN